MTLRKKSKKQQGGVAFPAKLHGRQRLVKSSTGQTNAQLPSALKSCSHNPELCLILKAEQQLLSAVSPVDVQSQSDVLLSRLYHNALGAV